MAKPRVYVTRHLPGGALGLLAQETNLRLWQGELPPPRQVLLEEARRCHGLLTLLTERIDAELLDAAPNLIVVSNMATGYDNVDVEAASARAVLVTRTPGVLAETTADFAFALLLAATRRLVEGDRYVRQGRWRTWGPEVLLGQDVHGATLGIVGLGGVGLEMANRGRGFAMRVLYYSRTRKPGAERRFRLTYAPLDQLLREADFVSLHLPLSPETQHLIGQRELSLMKPTAVLVNTSRGPVLDHGALYRALKEDRLGAAALDVTEVEPLASDDPLLTLDNVIITPHIASASIATRSRMAMLAAQNLLSALAGRIAKDAVNGEIGRHWRAARRQRLPAGQAGLAS